MSSLLVKGIIRHGRVEVKEPINAPDGTEVLVTSAVPADNGPMTLEEITQVLAAMQKVEPFEMTPEEEAKIEAERQKIKAYTIANMNKGIEELFQ